MATPCPHQHIAVSQRQPKTILFKAQQHWVIQDAARLIGNEHVLALTHCALREITRREQLYKGSCVWSCNLDLALYRNVAEDGVIHQAPEVLLGVTE